MKLKITASIALMAASAVATADYSDKVVKIGVLNDLSGVYSAAAGMGSVEAVRMAVEDFGGSVNGVPVEVVFADHQNSPDVGVATANRWYDQDKVDVIVDLPNSSIALAVSNIAKQKNKMMIGGGSASYRLTSQDCNANTINYIYDDYSMAKTAARAAVETVGKTFFFLTVDYTFGETLQRAATAFIEQAGGKVIGSVKHPLGATDFASFILQAQASGAEVIALASASTDTANAIAAAREFGLTEGGQNLMAFLVMTPDIHGIGLEQAQGLLVPTPFDWKMNEESAEWSRRYFKRMGAMPSWAQAGAYSYTMHYLNAVKNAGTDEAKTVVKKMKETPVDDWFTKGYIREDGRMIHDMYLTRVKTPEESTEAYDYFNIIEVVKGEDAYHPLDEKCVF